MAKSTQNKGVRIISGKWRSRRLAVLDVPGLRPSGDRLRETLFNWLQAELAGATCLDLFAGSGALGFEAASRGAARVLMLENNQQAVAQLQKNIQTLKAENITVMQVNTLTWLDQPAAQAFDIIFLDPPFSNNWQHLVLQKLLTNKLLKPGGIIYVESAHSDIPLQGAGDLLEIKNKLVGQVRMQLFGLTAG